MSNQKKLPSTILRMKKRLSETSVVPLFLGLSYVIISVVAIYSFRVVTAASAYDYVPGNIPVVAIPLNDPSEPPENRESSPQLSKETPVIVLTAEEFLFGDSKSFTGEISSLKNKFKVAHVDGQPQLGSLLTTLNEWAGTRPGGGAVLVFFPSDEIPMPIVLQVMGAIREHSRFKRIVLGGGII